MTLLSSILRDIWHYTNYWSQYLIAVIIVIVIIYLILEHRDPNKTLSWILVIILVPIVGLILFYFLGKNYRKKRIFTKKGIADIRQTEKLIAWQSEHLLDDLDIKNSNVLSKIGIIKLLINNNKALLTHNNKVTILNNGNETFPSIFEALKEAKHHIHLEYYMIEEGEIGEQLKSILIEKAKQGVEVRLLYDDVGSWGLSNEYISDLADAGINAHAFIPVRFPRFAQKINFRNHRKIIIVDGKTGFIGGLNFADRYLYGVQDVGFWRDTHLKIEGTSVGSLQVIFLTDWYFTTAQLLNEQIYFPKFNPCEKCLVQIATSGPDSDWDSIMQAYFYTISTAHNYLYISTPYFIPNESILTAIKTVALSGVDVKIILPSRNDSKLTYYGSMSYIKELLEANVSIFMYNRGFTHSKVLIVDDIISSVGTANMDLRSFDQNFEVNAIIYDEKISVKLKEFFLEDLTYCEKLNLETYNKRPIARRIAEGIARIFSPIL